MANTTVNTAGARRVKASRCVAGAPCLPCLPTRFLHHVVRATNNRTVFADITPTFDASITSLSDATTIEATINTAIANIDSYIATPINVSIDFKNINTGLADSITPQADLDYSTYLTDLQANPNKSATVVGALATLPAGPNTGINMPIGAAIMMDPT